MPLLQPKVAPADQLAFPPRQQPAAAAAEPVIQVTIGRIEVRATPPPLQPARPRPAAQSAGSLEEYLQRRSRRGDA